MLADFLIYHRQNLATYSTDEPLISSFKNGRSKLRASVKLRGYCKPNPLNCNLPNVTSQQNKKRSRPYIGLLPLYTSYLLLIHKQSAVLID